MSSVGVEHHATARHLVFYFIKVTPKNIIFLPNYA